MLNNNTIQIKINGQRWYLNNNQLKISVTQMLKIVDKGIGFQKWLGNSDSYAQAMQYAHMKADRGTTVHDDIATLLKGGKIDREGMKEWRIKRLKAFDKFMDKYKPVPIQIEKPLINNDLPYAGTGDLIANIDGKTILVDWKTGNTYKSHQIQLTCYYYLYDGVIDEMWLQRLPEYQTNYVYLPKPKKFIKPIDKEIIESIYNIWYWFRDGKKKFKTAYRKLNQDKYKITDKFEE